MKTCEEFQMAISDRHDSHISTEDETNLAVHLDGCKECQSFAKYVSNLGNTFVSLTENVEPGKTNRTKFWSKSVSVPWPVAASVVLLICWLALPNDPKQISTEPDISRSNFVTAISIERLEPRQASLVAPGINFDKE